MPALDRPRRFTEWVQWRKLNDREPALAALTDKLHSKALAGPLAVPTLWSGRLLPKDPPAPLPLMVKANHGCNQWRIVRSLAEWRRVRLRALLWLVTGYGTLLGEPHYAAARRLVLVEPLLGGAGAGLPVDYKVYVFGGRARLVQAHTGRGTDHRWTQFDRNWVPMSDDVVDVARPLHLAEMLDGAERLAGARDFLRVDFYEVDGRLWFGEFCLFPGSGLDPFRPDALDSQLGDWWAAARGMQPAA